MSVRTSSSKSSSKSSSSSSKTSSTKAPPPIVALPSLSSHLCSLPQAKNMESLPVHPSQSAQRHAESEAKLKKALERNVARQSLQSASQSSHAQYPPRTRLPPPTYSEPSSPLSHSPPLMMRKRPNPAC
ncbi:hypothetical protein BU17DRAFT_102874 [Hysterangium stoloniferum]|nr:hypothetical protein BU17DRAFT_102874 [Hysterangium stoloniferum]